MTARWAVRAGQTERRRGVRSESVLPHQKKATERLLFQTPSPLRGPLPLSGDVMRFAQTPSPAEPAHLPLSGDVEIGKIPTRKRRVDSLIIC